MKIINGGKKVANAKGNVMIEENEESLIKEKDIATDMDGNRLETKMRKLVCGIIARRINHPTLVDQVDIKPYSQNDTLYFMLELKNICLLMPNLEVYYLIYHLQVCLKVV